MSTTAILFANLGSPDAPDKASLKPYLTEFLMDERVIDKPKWFRQILVKGIIVPFRAEKSAKKYQSIWTSEGSPLIVFTKKFVKHVQQRFDIPVYFSMRYGKPKAADVLTQMHYENPDLEKIIFFPLYPHYAMSSYETAVEQVKSIHAAKKYASQLEIIEPIYNHPLYIDALSKSIQPYIQNNQDAHVLFSYHGIPERHVQKTDCTGSHCLKKNDCCNTPSEAHAFCYRHQVITTTELTAHALGLAKDKYSLSFQSRLGRDPWLQPFTDLELKQFPSKGIKNLLVACPAFVSDCLETLEEIEMEGEESFLESGGESFRMIPALNTQQVWIDCVEKILKNKIAAEKISE